MVKEGRNNLYTCSYKYGRTTISELSSAASIPHLNSLFITDCFIASGVNSSSCIENFHLLQ